MKHIAEELNARFQGASAPEVLAWFLNEYGDTIALASSFGAEDQVVTDLLFGISPEAKIFTLDTGRLPYETYDVMDRTNLKYGTKIAIYFPEAEDIQNLYATQGVNGFYESVERRKACCHVRKILPLRRALKGLNVWITGLRREQSVTRDSMQMVEWDEGNNLIKLNPLIEWDEAAVWDYLKQHRVPYNKLHDQGYPSIGCAPCTRAVAPGEDVRAGRWWWENPEHKECGLHFKEKGKEQQ